MAARRSQTDSSSSAKDRRLETYLLEVARGKPGIGPSLLRGITSGLAPVYCAGLKTYLLPYNIGLRKRKRLDCPVICIGNLTTGGTGKTPLTQTLCRHLQARNKRVVILSRGYGGENEYGSAIVSDTKEVLLTAKQAGDEAFLLASTLPGIPVVVGKDRRITGALAMERFAPDVIVLDDGMQFWQLHRDLDVVLLNALAPFDNGWTFPRGLLREPPSHLKRAGTIILTNAHRASPEQLAYAQREVRRFAPGTPVFTADLAPVALRTFAENTRLPPEWLRGRKVAALSALGNPESFETILESLGATLVHRSRFRDHQEIGAEELRRVGTEAQSVDAEAIVTTAKDGVKMAAWERELPLLILDVAMQLDHEAGFLNVVENVFASCHHVARG